MALGAAHGETPAASSMNKPRQRRDRPRRALGPRGGRVRSRSSWRVTNATRTITMARDADADNARRTSTGRSPRVRAPSRRACPRPIDRRAGRARPPRRSDCRAAHEHVVAMARAPRAACVGAGRRQSEGLGACAARRQDGRVRAHNDADGGARARRYCRRRALARAGARSPPTLGHKQRPGASRGAVGGRNGARRAGGHEEDGHVLRWPLVRG